VLHIATAWVAILPARPNASAITMPTANSFLAAVHAAKTVVNPAAKTVLPLQVKRKPVAKTAQPRPIKKTAAKTVKAMPIPISTVPLPAKRKPAAVAKKQQLQQKLHLLNNYNLNLIVKAEYESVRLFFKLRDGLIYNIFWPFFGVFRGMYNS
jgi:hypothetical protein